MVVWIAKKSDDKDQSLERNTLFVEGVWIHSAYCSSYN